MNSLQVWSAYYYVSHGWGAYDEHRAVVVANTESEALGLLLNAYSDTSAGGWTLGPIDTTKPNVDHIDSRY